MPGYNRAPLSAELTVPDEQLDAALEAGAHVVEVRVEATGDAERFH